MSKKELETIENILNQSLDQIMSDRFGRYSKYIIQGRALPDVRDGLKPVQRRIIYAMNDLGLFSDKPFKKSARIVGEVIGKYHPHGDSSIYEAMVRMAQDWKMNVPLIEMHGNKGSVDDDPAAAMRYTETRLAKITKSMLIGIKKKTVSFAPNFDDSEVEPTVLPGLMPNLLVNGAKGIASGYATEMPPHNLGEVIDAIILKIKSPNARLETLMKYIKGPDFPTGGEVQGLDGIYSAFERGKGRIVIRSKYSINDSKTNPYIEITEIPYGVIKSKLVRDIDAKRFNKEISGIKDVRDESDRNGISIIIELSPGSNPQLIINYLLSKTELQIYYNYNNVGIVNNGPKLMGLNQLIDAYLEHQRKIQLKVIEFDFNKDKKRLEIVEGLIKVSLIVDKVIEIIKNAEGSRQGVVKSLINNLNFTELQANAIADLRLYRLSKTDQSIYIEEKNLLIERISNYKKLLNSKEELDKYLISILSEFKKSFATPRKSIITNSIQKLEINMEDLIKHEDVWVGVSRQGYVKRISNRAYEANTIDKYSLKPGDTLVYLHKINTADKLLIFTSSGRYITIPTHLISESKWKDAGRHINDFASIDVNEHIVEAISVNDFSLPLYLVAVTKNGKVKRTRVSDFEVSRFSKPLIAIKLDVSDHLVGIRVTNGFDQIVVISSNGKAVKYSETQIPLQGTKSKGVKGMSLANGVYVNNFVAGYNEDIIGLISKRGGTKRIKMSEIISSSRTTQGKEIFRLVKGNPHIVIDARIVKPETRITFKDDSEFLKLFEFKNTHISSTNEGFSITGEPNTLDGKILKFHRIHKESSIFKKPQLKDDDIFKKAEEKIDAIDQVSIDDILKVI
ncbi:MAG: DNA topoisomerase IV subunit A [Mycoplasmatales bacterium]|nr:DNA topoisomerase IV subunit A [Mycoplasmatales bacterium]